MHQFDEALIVPLSGCTTLTKFFQKKLDRNYTRIQRNVSKIS